MTLTIDLSQSEEERLAILANREGIAPSAYAKRMIFERLPELETASDEAGKSLYDLYGHLFGTVKGGPTDVARNPAKYLIGFGTR